MKLGSVQIERPWMNMTFFKLGNWYLKEQRKGCVSSGQVPGVDGLLLPQFPVQLLVARDIQISGTWSESDKKQIEKAISGGLGVGWGPFKIGGSYEASENHTEFSSTFDGTTITVPGIQIIGFVSSIPTPLCPPINDPKLDT
jgi:hypothetical protein